MYKRRCQLKFHRRSKAHFSGQSDVNRKSEIKMALSNNEKRNVVLNSYANTQIRDKRCREQNRGY